MIYHLQCYYHLVKLHYLYFIKLSIISVLFLIVLIVNFQSSMMFEAFLNSLIYYFIKMEITSIVFILLFIHKYHYLNSIVFIILSTSFMNRSHESNGINLLKSKPHKYSLILPQCLIILLILISLLNIFSKYHF